MFSVPCIMVRQRTHVRYVLLLLYSPACVTLLAPHTRGRAAMALIFDGLGTSAAPPAAGTTEAEQRLRELRRLILAKEYTRRYADFLCADSQLIAILAADGDAPLRDMLAGAGVPLLHRKHVAGFVREAQSMPEAQSMSEAGPPADMDQSVDPEAAACAVETETGEGEATGSGDEMDVAGDAEASGDGVQEMGDDAVGSCSSESVAAGGMATRGDESAHEFSSEEIVASSEELVASRDLASSDVASSDVASSEEVIPAPKARLFCASSFGGEAWSLFRANPTPDPDPNPKPNSSPNPDHNPNPSSKP